jgi:hypothetical protein
MLDPQPTAVDDALIDQARQAVVKSTVHNSYDLYLYAGPVIDAAAALLADLWSTAARHQVASKQLDIAYTCLDAVARQHRADVPQTEQDAARLLNAVVAELNALGVAAVTDDQLGMAVLPRTEETPSWGYSEPLNLGVVTDYGSDGGWGLALQVRGAAVRNVVATFDEDGVAAVARLAVAVNAGRLGNPFRFR